MGDQDLVAAKVELAGAGISLMYFPGSRASLREKPSYEEMRRKLADTTAVRE